MGYAVYWSDKQRRFCGYGVTAYCDYPFCDKEIDRGMGYVCGEPLQDRFGCGGYFCSLHRSYTRQPRGEDCFYENCKRCYRYRTPYKFNRPEHPTWVKHLLNNATWQKWRNQNPDQLQNLKLYQRHYNPTESK